MTTQPTNANIVELLERIANLLEELDENPHRVRAYRAAAQTIALSDDPVAEWGATENRRALMQLPGVGEGLANLIIDYARTGESALLNELEGRADPAGAFMRTPGIGPALARRIRQELNIETLEELEVAAHDGRLGAVEGFGPERVKAVQTSLAGMLSESARRRARQRARDDDDEPRPAEPSVSTLLDVDAEYRRRAAAGDLPTIAPRRFNPEGRSWLPLLTTKRGEWSFTAMFSNTARAHEAGKTDDWVVIYFERPNSEEQQRTVVTETRGPLAGKRVVRGRDAENKQHYEG